MMSDPWWIATCSSAFRLGLGFRMDTLLIYMTEQEYRQKMDLMDTACNIQYLFNTF